MPDTTSSIPPEPSSAPQEAGLSTPRCPYPGLRAFFTDEADWYFGRESHVHAALTRMEDHRFLAIVGASGSGKSSLVFAGIIPALKAGELADRRRGKPTASIEPDSTTGGKPVSEFGEPAAETPAPWSIVHFRPGGNPLQALTEALVKASPQSGDPLLPGFVQAALYSGDMGLVEALKSAGHVGESREILVYIDQFEELIHYSDHASLQSREEAQRFARLIVTAATQNEVRLHLLLSMRSDFIGDCDRFPGLPELICTSQFLTPRLTRKQMELSFGLPAEVQGWSVEPEALNTLLNDCGDSPDQLPLAQHVIRRMWRHAEKQGRTVLTLDDYHEVGGFKGSLNKHGAEILHDLIRETGPEAKERARKLFMALCDQSEDGPLVRRHSHRERLSTIIGCSPNELEPVIHAFGGDDPGFLREDETGMLDVRHESILRQWQQIGEWRRKETESEDWLHQLSKASHEMRAGGGPDESILWRGGKLRRALDWRRNAAPTAAWAERHGVSNWTQCEDFLDQSIEAETAAIQKSRTRRTVIGLVTAVALAILFVLWRRSEESTAQARIAAAEAAASHESAQKALEAAEEAKRQKAIAEEERDKALEATRNFEKEKDSQRQQLLSQSNQEKDQLEKKLRETEEKLLAVSTSINQAEVTRIIDEAVNSIQNDPLVARLEGASRDITIAEYTADGRFVAVGSADKKIRVWNRLGGAQIGASTSTGGVTTLAFSPDSPILLSGSSGNSIRLFDPRLKDLGGTKEITVHNDTVTHIEFSPDGRYSVSSSADGTIALLDWSLYPKVIPQKSLAPDFWRHEKAITSVTFSADGSRIVTSADDRRIKVFEAHPPFGLVKASYGTETLNPFTYKEEGTVTRKTKFSPKDNEILCGGSGRNGVVWLSLKGDRQVLIRDDAKSGPFHHEGAVIDLAFRPSGRHVATIASDGVCLIWDASTATTITRLPTEIQGRLFDVAWSGDDQLALVGEDGWLELWDLRAPQSPTPLFATQAHQGVAKGVRFDPLKKQILTWSGYTGDSTKLTPKGKAAAYKPPANAPRSDNTAALWDIESAIRNGWSKHPR
jgi:WD40 repeat protein/energy-coupling factor transporter ATP-binding protein EcfA2